MPDSIFNTAFNFGNADFKRDAGEEFDVVAKTGPACGTPGTYTANSIDDLTTTISGAPGGKINNVNVHVYLDKTLRASIGLITGAVLLVRGERCRVGPIQDCGDNKVMLICEKVGVRAS